jgi:hypothetical protein
MVWLGGGFRSEEFHLMAQAGTFAREEHGDGFHAADARVKDGAGNEDAHGVRMGA